MKECQTGCKNFSGGEIYHHPDCQYYKGSLSEELDILREQAKNLHKPLVIGSLPKTCKECGRQIVYDKDNEYGKICECFWQ